MAAATITEPKTEQQQKCLRDLQDFYLGIAIRDKIPVTIYFVSGAKVTGTLESFDKYSVILDSPDRQLLIFKHAISVIRPG